MFFFNHQYNWKEFSVSLICSLLEYCTTPTKGSYFSMETPLLSQFVCIHTVTGSSFVTLRNNQKYSALVWGTFLEPFFCTPVELTVGFDIFGPWSPFIFLDFLRFSVNWNWIFCHFCRFTIVIFSFSAMFSVCASFWFLFVSYGEILSLCHNFQYNTPLLPTFIFPLNPIIWEWISFQFLLICIEYT